MIDVTVGKSTNSNATGVFVAINPGKTFAWERSGDEIVHVSRRRGHTVDPPYRGILNRTIVVTDRGILPASGQEPVARNALVAAEVEEEEEEEGFEEAVEV